ncbi:MAG: preprotein translocase subunit YajC [Spirochaetes bacterium GWD1_27_9]|nr:MAG: preprotein translocase subunit YajC [Spirochaetes bacterium GWB1_27_13]OHD22500.1 MAG: preprotein translocase subunit YajC [Spirochaetes bacterium GWC1_27_15]OHD42864.1 MAG: preprotein translocase subunit YajC [Spirochaetes bacterium GWD1_27_9]
MIGQTTTGKGGFNETIMMTGFMVVFIIFFYFVVVRPQNKKKKEMENLLKSVKPGDKVVTIGGCHGKVVHVKDDTVTIRVDDRAEITYDKTAIARVVDVAGGHKGSGEKKVTDNKEDSTSTEEKKE